MKSRHWETTHILKSRLIPEAFFGSVYPEWNIENPKETFSGFTYAIEVEDSHKGWDHFVGILYLKQFPQGPPGTGISGKQRETEMTVRMKSSVSPGTYQFMLNLYTLPGVSEEHASLFELPIDTSINFYVRPYLISPTTKGIYYLWDRWSGENGFPVGTPGVISRGQLPFLGAS